MPSKLFIWSVVLLKKFKVRMFEILGSYNGVIWALQMDTRFIIMAINAPPFSICSVNMMLLYNVQ